MTSPSFESIFPSSFMTQDRSYIEAEKKAKDLFISYLNEEQLYMFKASSERYIPIRGSSGGKYIQNLSKASTNIIDWSEPTSFKKTYCLTSPSGTFPRYDTLLSQKLFLETNERLFLNNATAWDSQSWYQGDTLRFFGNISFERFISLTEEEYNIPPDRAEILYPPEWIITSLLESLHIDFPVRRIYADPPQVLDNKYVLVTPSTHDLYPNVDIDVVHLNKYAFRDFAGITRTFKAGVSEKRPIIILTQTN